MIRKALIVLGAPNSPKGKLSKISKSRLDYCIKLYQPGNLVLCTGGWGAHFNASKEAHAVYAQRYLIDHGIPADSFLENALSENTVDDALKILPIISCLGELDLTVISSDFHIDRVKLIFDEILSQYKISYITAHSPVPEKEMIALIGHERKAVAKILKNGLYY